MTEHPASRTFEYRGQAVDVSYTGPNWVVTVGDKTVESRRLDEALEATLGKSVDVVKLTVEILGWATPEA